MIIDQTVLDDLTAQAQASPRLRMNMDLRNSPADGSQRMLNAIEPGSPLPIHRHTKSSETVVCLRGHLREVFYNDAGEVTEVIDLAPGSDCVALCIPIDTILAKCPRFNRWVLQLEEGLKAGRFL